MKFYIISDLIFSFHVLWWFLGKSKNNFYYYYFKEPSVFNFRSKKLQHETFGTDLLPEKVFTENKNIYKNLYCKTNIIYILSPL